MSKRKAKQDDVAAKIPTEASKETNPPATRDETPEKSKASKSMNLATSSPSQNTSQDSQIERTILLFDIPKLHRMNTKSVILKRTKGSAFATPLSSTEYTPNRTSTIPEEMVLIDPEDEEDLLKEPINKFKAECEVEKVTMETLKYMVTSCGWSFQNNHSYSESFKHHM